MSSKEAQQLLDIGVGDVIQITAMKSSCRSCNSAAPLSSASSSGHNIDCPEDHHRPSSYHPSPSNKERSSRDTLKKFVRGSNDDPHKYGSIERGVYTVTKSGGDKGPGGKWDQLKNMVRPVRVGKESGHDQRRTASPDEENKRALAQLDSVINTYHHKGSGGSNTTKRNKKKEKDNTGGTWPKYKGGTLSMWDPSNDQTVIKVEPTSRKRPPLTTIYPPADYDTRQLKASFDIYRPPKHDGLGGNERSSSPHSQGFSDFGKNLDGGSSGQQYGMYGPSTGGYPKTPGYAGVNQRPPVDEDKREENERETRLGSLTPSDTSLDFSVRSGNVGKEELAYYVKKNIVKCPFSDTESNVSPVNASPQPLSLPVTYGYRPYNLRQISETLPANPRGSLHPHTGLYSPPPNAGGLRSPHSFVPYSPFSHYAVSHQHTHPHTTVSSFPTANSPLNYSTPPSIPPHPSSPYLPPSRSGDSLLSSPGQDRDPSDTVGYYENRLSPCPSTAMRVPNSSSGGLYYQQLSSSPSLDFANKLYGESRGKQHRNKHPPSHDDSALMPPSTRPPSYHDYQRAVTTMPRKRDDEKIRWESLKIIPIVDKSNDKMLQGEVF